MPNYLEDFYQELRDYLSNNKRSTAVQNSYINTAQKQTCLFISRYKPRVNQKKDVIIDANSASVELPSNFRSAKLGALYKLKYKNSLLDSSLANQEIDIYSNNSYGNQRRSRFDTDGMAFAQVPNFGGNPIGGWPGLGSYADYNLRGSVGSVDSFILEIFSNGKKGWSLWFDDDQEVTARTEKLFPYTAIHEITADLDTITSDIRDVFLDLCSKYTFLEASRQFAKEGQTSEAKVFAEQAELYGNSIFELGATVAVTEIG